jgi:peptidyl-dipeptidase Dcp
MKINLLIQTVEEIYLKRNPDYQIPFHKLKSEDFLVAAKHYLKLSNKRIKQVKKEQSPSFENIVEALESSDLELCAVVSIFDTLNNAYKTKAVQSISEEMARIEIKSELWMYDQEVFKQLERVYQVRDELNLTRPQRKLLEDSYASMKKSGVNCSEEVKEKLKIIEKQSSKAMTRYGNKLLKDSQFEVCATREEISGIAEEEVARARARAKSKGKTGYIFSDEEYQGIIDFADNRELRRKMFMRTMQSGISQNKTEGEILKIVSLRQEEAKIKGYADYVSMVLEDRMVKTPQELNNFLSKMTTQAKTQSIKDLALISAFAKEKDGIEEVHPYDETYYKKKIVEEKFNVDLKEIRNYFPLHSVWSGLSTLVSDIFELTLTEEKYTSFDKSVKAYRVVDKQGKKRGTLLVDLFYRATKPDGAFMINVVAPGYQVPPTVLLSMNLTDKTKTLMSLGDITTLFHEMGHCLHSLLSTAYYPSQAGTNVIDDFVELPALFMENLMDNVSVLKNSSCHRDTGKKIPTKIAEKIIAMNNFLNSPYYSNLIYYSELDIRLHSQEGIKDLLSFEKTLQDSLYHYPYMANTSHLASFSHIIDSGYQAGYYSYLWADVLNKDAYQLCLQTGGLKSPYLKKFKELLEAGSSEDEAELYRKFKGSDPDVESFFRTQGWK